MAKGAAFQIHQFVLEIDNTIRLSTQTPDIVRAGLTESFEFQLAQLMKAVPAIITVAALNENGHERFKLSRVEMIRRRFGRSFDRRSICPGPTRRFLLWAGLLRS